MRRRGIVLAGLCVVAALVGVIAWFIAADPGHAGVASVVSATAAGAPTADVPQIVAGGSDRDVVDLEVPVASGGATAGDATAPPARLRCMVLSSGDGKPIAGVAVRAFYQFDPYRAGPGRDVARTGADGVANFEFPGRVKVSLVRALPGPGHAMCVLRPKLVIEAGEEKTLECRARLGATVRGTVVDEHSVPVSHAQVSAWCEYRSSIESAGGEPVRDAQIELEADGAGRFAAEGVGPPFVLMAAAPGMASLRGFEGEVKEGAVLDDVQLVVGPAKEIRGRVLDPDRQPIARLWVNALNSQPDGGMGAPAECEPLKVTAITGEDGRFVLAPLAARKWLISVKDKRFAQWSKTREPDSGELEIVLSGGCRVRGIVRGASGAPVVGARIGLYGASEDVGHGPSGFASTETDATGTFGFSGLIPAEDVFLSVLAPDHAVYCMDKLVVSTDDGEDLQIRLATELRIGGHVVDEQGDAIPGARVSIRGDRVLRVNWAPQPTWEGIAGKGVAVAGADGQFHFGSLYDGDFALTVEDPRNQGLRKTLTIRAGVEDVLVQLDAGALSGAVVRGTVRDGLTNAPLQDFSVWLASMDEARGKAGQPSSGASFHDPQGNYFLQGIEPGAYTVTAQADGHADTREKARTLVTGENRVDLVLLPERTLHLRVVDQGGAPVYAALVSFEDVRGEPILLTDPPKGDETTGATDRNGEVTAQSLPAANIVVVLKVMRVWDFFEGAAEFRFPFDLRQEPVGIQQVTVERPKGRWLVLYLYEGDQAAELNGQDPADETWGQRVGTHLADGTLLPLAVSVHASVQAANGDVVDSATCVPDGKGGYALQSSAYAGASRLSAVLLHLPSDVSRLDVAADGCAPEALTIPAGGENVHRLVVLRATSPH